MARPALAADRAMQVIDLLVSHATQRMSLTEIVRSTGINPASAHALVHALVAGGYLQRHESHKTYGLGPALVAAGTVALEQIPELGYATRELDALSDELSLEMVLTVPVGAEILVVARSVHATAFGPGMQVGQRVPMNPPIGAVFLAFAPPSEIDAWLGRAGEPLSDDEVTRQRAALASVRQHRYSVTLESPSRRELGSALVGSAGPDHLTTFGRVLDRLARVPYQLEEIDPERSYEVSLVAVPVFDTRRRAVAAISAMGFPPAMPGAELRRVAEALRGRAAVITKRSHGKLP